MARQKGGIPFVGGLGELSFYLDKQHGYLIRRKGGPNKQQIKKKKSMEAVRQNNSEFGKSSSYGALLRRAFRPLILHCREYTMSRRLQSLLLSVIKMDESKGPGKRDVLKKHLIALQEFELNAHASCRKYFKKDIDIVANEKCIRVKGCCTVSRTVAKKASHYQVISAAASIDFQKRKYVQDVKESKLLPCEEGKAFVFEHNLSETDYLFYGFVVCFYNKNREKFELMTEDEMKAGFISFISI